MSPELIEIPENSNSVTYRIKVGCGNLYVTIVTRDKGRFDRVIIPRQSKFYCPHTTRDAIQRLVTFGGRRNLRQVIKDLRGDKFGHHCDKYNVNAEASSCFDAVSKVLEKWQKQRRKRQKGARGTS